MRFPETPRVVYRKNPLAEVICQLRFPRILQIDAEVPATFHQSIRDRYPVVVEGPVVPTMPPELTKLLGVDLALSTTQKAFDFASEDGVYRVSITSQFLALTCAAYERWEVFAQSLEHAWSRFNEIYRPSYLTRIGLRYRDLIQRSKLDLAGEKWRHLLRSHVLGEVAELDEQAILQAGRELVIGLDHHDAKVRVFHGFAKVQNSSEQCYLIDADFFTEQRTEQGNARGILDQFNREAGTLFRWCIADRLHDAMQPEGIRDNRE